MNTHETTHFGRTSFLAVLTAFALASPEAATSQETFTACYVPSVGAIYMIGLPGLPTACLSTEHEEISWTEGGAVAAGAIGSTELADGAVTSAKIATSAVGAAQISDGSVGAAEIASGAVGADEIADGAVTSAKLGSDVSVGVADGSIGTDQLADGAVTGAKIAANAIGQAELAVGAVGSEDVADNTLTSDDLGTNSVGTVELQDGSVTSIKVADNSLTASDLAANSVGASEIAAGAVGTSEFANAALRPQHLPSGFNVWDFGGGFGGKIRLHAGPAGSGIASGTVLLSSWESTEVAGPQARFQGNAGGFWDYGLNSSGDFVIERNDGAACTITTGTLAWACASDRALKEGFEPLDSERVLDDLSRMSIESWSYLGSPSVRHVGPVAQDFFATFGLGDDDRKIGVLDAAGISMVAIQALEARTTRLAEENIRLRARVDALLAALGTARERD